jgi:ABC-type uncharacterized transport system substrate-binding protein
MKLVQNFVEGRNVAIEFRYADGRYHRLPALAAELVSRGVNVIVAVPSSPAALAARSATQKIPFVFLLGAPSETSATEICSDAQGAAHMTV